MEFEKQLSDEECENYFQQMFGNVWTHDMLESILFPNGFGNSKAYLVFTERNERNEKDQESEFHFLAGHLGNSLWEIFSNNNDVFRVNDLSEFSLGTWRSSGSFIAGFIEKQNEKLLFDYLSFYMGHIYEDLEAKKSYEFIFAKLKSNGFDWQYNYPSLGIVDFSALKKDDLERYDPNEAIEKEISKNNLQQLINESNQERKKAIQNASTPTIIIAYANVFGKYPEGWED